MNAYELADELRKFSIGNKSTLPWEAYVMINKQADQIEQLKKEFDAMVMSFESRLATRGYEIQIKDQADRIAELEAELKLIDELIRGKK